MSWLLRLYPRAWRVRYEEEVSDLLESEPVSVRLLLDLVGGAIDARFNPEWIPAAVRPEGGPEMSDPLATGGPALVFHTANSRLKESSGSVFWFSLVAATMLHFAVLAFWPNLRASDLSFTMDEIEAIELPPEIEIPPPPETISRPASPVVTTAEISTDVTIAPTTFDANPIEDLPPPPTDTGVDISTQPSFTPHDVRPEVRNLAEVQRRLEREYPPTLRDAGISGRVLVHFFVNERGVVETTLVAKSSGFEQFDAAALRVAEMMEFTPALNQGEQVAVWIQLPLGWTSQ